MTRDEQMRKANPYPCKATVLYALVRNDAFIEGWKAADATPSEDVRALAVGIKESRQVDTDFQGGVTCVYCGHGADYLQDLTHADNCPVSIADRILKEEA